MSSIPSQKPHVLVYFSGLLLIPTITASGIDALVIIVQKLVQFSFFLLCQPCRWLLVHGGVGISLRISHLPPRLWSQQV